MNIRNIGVGAFNSDLNKAKFDFCYVGNDDGMKYLIHNNQYFEFKRNRDTGRIHIIDVTNAGQKGGITTLSIDNPKDGSGHRTTVCNELNTEFGFNIDVFVNWFNGIAKKLKSKENQDIELEIGEGNLPIVITFPKSQKFFSFLGDFNPVLKRPKRLMNWTVVRMLMNFQVQQVESHEQDREVYTGVPDFDKTPSSFVDNVSLAEDLNKYQRTSISWRGNNVDGNLIWIYFSPKSSYVLEIVDPKLFAKK